MLKPYGSRDRILGEKRDISAQTYSRLSLLYFFSEVFKVYYTLQTKICALSWSQLSGTAGHAGALCACSFLVGTKAHVCGARAHVWCLNILWDTTGLFVPLGRGGRFFPASPPSRERTLSTAVKMRDRGASLGFVCHYRMNWSELGNSLPKNLVLSVYSCFVCFSKLLWWRHGCLCFSKNNQMP